jgi:ribosome biogenesis GTPase / thiamine phosphate phosphatase
MSERAVVTATFGRRLGLRLERGDEVAGRIKGKILRPVCGDRVEVRSLPNEPEWLVTGILPRDNELTRPNLRGKVEVLAANVDAIAVVAAELPRPDWFIVDAYLCAAELMAATAAVVFNKADLGEPSESSADALAELSAAGYEVLRCSAKNGLGIAGLRNFLARHTAVVVGQSGVGKSSLINALVGEDARATAEVSRATREGRHRTANSVMLPLANGGAVIDSPGVREYAPAIADPAQVARGFREIRIAGEACRFANCRHLREPGCNVKEQVAAGAISARRYESYRRMLAKAKRLAER